MISVNIRKSWSLRGSASLVLLIIVFVIVAGVYYWVFERAVCDRTLSYALGSFDDGFDIASGEFLEAIRDAESVWESGTGFNLFEYDPSASFVINLVFDERQAETVVLKELEEDIGIGIHGISSLQADYSTLHGQYEERILSYEIEVRKWNDSGGAPPDAFRDLQKERRALELMRIRINSLARRINVYVNDHNITVNVYNSRVGGEFTQGDYIGDSITIYQFDDRRELLLVLVHELGHALGLGHVENDSSSIMYRIMGDQDINNVSLTPEDINALEFVCDLETLSN